MSMNHDAIIRDEEMDELRAQLAAAQAKLTTSKTLLKAGSEKIEEMRREIEALKAKKDLTPDDRMSVAALYGFEAGERETGLRHERWREKVIDLKAESNLLRREAAAANERAKRLEGELRAAQAAFKDLDAVYRAELGKIMNAKADTWEDVARFAIEWMKNPGGIDARFIAAVREQGQCLRGFETTEL